MRCNQVAHAHERGWEEGQAARGLERQSVRGLLPGYELDRFLPREYNTDMSSSEEKQAQLRLSRAQEVLLLALEERGGAEENELETLRLALNLANQDFQHALQALLDHQLVGSSPHLPIYQLTTSGRRAHQALAARA